MTSRLLASLFLLLSITVSEAKVINFDPGGLISKYDRKFAELERSGVHVVINGACMSACTRFMRLQNVCATKYGYFYFHGVTTKKGAVRPEWGWEDGRLTNLPEAFYLQQKYGVFFYGTVNHPPAKEYLEPGVERVYTSMRKDPSLSQVWLKVKATKLVKPC
jgi:hypothetical protein